MPTCVVWLTHWKNPPHSRQSRRTEDLPREAVRLIRSSLLWDVSSLTNARGKYCESSTNRRAVEEARQAAETALTLQPNLGRPPKGVTTLSEDYDPAVITLSRASFARLEPGFRSGDAAWRQRRGIGAKPASANRGLAAQRYLITQHAKKSLFLVSQKRCESLMRFSLHRTIWIPCTKAGIAQARAFCRGPGAPSSAPPGPIDSR
jgi:hypothetical protein